jgi:ligand-binding SRPBCC domain-containing protein
MSYHLSRSLVVPRPLDEVFAFFGDARNLERLTPAFLNFKILTPQPIEMRPGTLIDYRISLRGLPMKWTSEITEWRPPFAFVDEQRRGPYRKWIHRHTFTEVPGGTRVSDDVEYDVLGGALIHTLFVKRDLETIFNYRLAVLSDLFHDELA